MLMPTRVYLSFCAKLMFSIFCPQTLYSLFSIINIHMISWCIIQINFALGQPNLTSMFVRLKASYCKISQSIEVVRSGIKMLISLWNFAGFSAAVLPPRCPIPPPPTPPTHTHTHTHPHPNTHSPHPPTPPTQYESVVTSSMTMKLKKLLCFNFDES